MQLNNIQNLKRNQQYFKVVERIRKKKEELLKLESTRKVLALKVFDTKKI
jgi:hypothetical protein